MFAKPSRLPSPSKFFQVSLLAASFIVDSANAQSTPETVDTTNGVPREEAKQPPSRIDNLKNLRETLSGLETNLLAIIKLEQASPGAMTNNAKIPELRETLEAHTEVLLRAGRLDNVETQLSGGKAINTTPLVIALSELTSILHPNTIGTNWMTKVEGKKGYAGLLRTQETVVALRSLSFDCFGQIAGVQVKDTVKEPTPSNDTQDKK